MFISVVYRQTKQRYAYHHLSCLQMDIKYNFPAVFVTRKPTSSRLSHSIYHSLVHLHQIVLLNEFCQLLRLLSVV